MFSSPGASGRIRAGVRAAAQDTIEPLDLQRRPKTDRFRPGPSSRPKALARRPDMHARRVGLAAAIPVASHMRNAAPYLKGTEVGLLALRFSQEHFTTG